MFNYRRRLIAGIRNNYKIARAEEKTKNKRRRRKRVRVDATATSRLNERIVSGRPRHPCNA